MGGEGFRRPFLENMASVGRQGENVKLVTVAFDRAMDFGQKGGRPMPTATDAHALPVDAPKVTEVPLKSRRDDARQGDSR